MIRLQDKTPEVYCAESRDFQLLCRLYDCVLNGIKFDIDTIPDILDSMTCRASMLQLLQTKLGFFTTKQLTDDELRYVLAAFPIMVRNKGSLLAIQQAVNVFFKVYGIRSEVRIWSVDEATLVYDTWVQDHTIVIGINSTITDVSLLEEIFKYILPAGFGYYFYFYNEITQLDAYQQLDNATLLLVSDNINSQVWANDELLSENQARLMHGVDTLSVASVENPIHTTTGTYDPGDKSKFLGLFSSSSDISGNDGDIIIINTGTENQELIWTNDHWQEINFRGIYTSLNLINNVTNYDIVALNEEATYWCIIQDEYRRLRFRGNYSSLNEVLYPKTNDIVKVQGEWYVKTNADWVSYMYVERGNVRPPLEQALANTIYIEQVYNYYMCSDSQSGKWDKINTPLYLLSEYQLSDEV